VIGLGRLAEHRGEELHPLGCRLVAGLGPQALEQRAELEQRVVADPRQGSVPRAPPGPDRQPKDPLLAERDRVEAAVVALESHAASLVDDEVGPHEVGALLAEPARAEPAARLLVRRRNDQKLAPSRPPALGCERRDRGDLCRDLALHVERTAAPDLAVDHVAAPGITAPFRRIGGNGVGVAEQTQRRSVGIPRETRDEVRALGDAARELAFEARVGQHLAEQLLDRTLATGRVGGVDPDQALEQLRRGCAELRPGGERDLSHRGQVTPAKTSSQRAPG
jgi:hypothetical protein